MVVKDKTVYNQHSDTIIARGTEEGLVLRVDGRNSHERLSAALKAFFTSRKRFLSGSKGVTLEWLEVEPDPAVSQALANEIRDTFGLNLREIRFKQRELPESGSAYQSSHEKIEFSKRQFSHSQGPQGQRDRRRDEKEIVQRSEPKIYSSRNISEGDPLLTNEVISSGSSTLRAANTAGDEADLEEVKIDSLLMGGEEEDNHSKNTNYPDEEQINFEEEAYSDTDGYANTGEKLFRGIDVLQRLGNDQRLRSGGERRGGRSRLSSNAGRSNQEVSLPYGEGKILYHTLRSGQRIESNETVIIFGDVNSGAEVVSGGDVIVLGILRGIAHAGAFQEDGAGNMILALSLQPTQLRIGAIITRGSMEVGAQSLATLQVGSQHLPEFARVVGDAIVVEPYISKFSATHFQQRQAKLRVAKNVFNT
jgi:septum formation inhibitor MinC